MSFIKERPQAYQVQNNPVSITLANSPYTVPANISEVNVNTAGGNVRVNLPNSTRKITVNKTSSDSYLVTLYVSGTQIGEISGELSSVLIESGQITKDEPWYPYDMIVSIVGVGGDGGEIISKNKYGKCLSSSWRGVAGTNDSAVIIAAIAAGNDIFIKRNSATSYSISDEIPIYLKSKGFRINSDGAILKATSALGANLDPIYGTGAPYTNQNIFTVYRSRDIIISNVLLDLNNVIGTNGIHVYGRNIWSGAETNFNLIENVHVQNAMPYTGGSNLAGVGFLMYAALGNVFRNCRSYNNGIGFKTVDHPTQVPECHQNIFDTCVADSSHQTNNALNGLGFYVISDPGVRFLHCTTMNNAGVGIWLGEHQPNDNGIFIDDLVCYNNGTNGLIVPTSSGCGLSIDSDRVHVSNSIFSYNKKCGIFIGGHCVVTGCTIKNNGQDTGRGGWERAGLGFSATAGNRGDCVFEGNTLLDNQVSHTQLYGYYEDGAATLNRLMNNQYYGLTTNIIGGVISNDVGYVARGSSTGTGSEQTIAHGLAAIPTGCKAWIKYLVGARYHTEEIDFDATNIYPTVPTGIAYEWRVE